MAPAPDAIAHNLISYQSPAPAGSQKDPLGAIVMGDQTLTSLKVDTTYGPDTPLSDLIAGVWCQIVDQKN
jgi:hypothetical protein